MKKYIAILEDDNRRADAMRRELAHTIPNLECLVFDNAPEMISWLNDSLEKVVLISLDHDLGPNRGPNSNQFDPGSGRDVADFLVTKPPICTIIIHTTNHFGGDGMRYALEDAQWPVKRIVPYDDLAWIEKNWIQMVAQSV